ncbi:MAG: hypothetical protein ACHQVS_03495 [Candidatus Babeliales bacterium]
MKVIRLLLCIILMHPLLQACPTCIGRLDKNTPPFFSAEYDEHYHQSFAPIQEDNEDAMVEEEA